MKVATPTFWALRKVTHFWAVSMVSTTMLSSAPQLDEMAMSYFSSMAPRSPWSETARKAHSLCLKGQRLKMLKMGGGKKWTLSGYVSHQTSQDAGDLSAAFLLHERVEHFASAPGGGQRRLGFFDLLPHVPDRSLGLSILLRNLLQLPLILCTHNIGLYAKKKSCYMTTIKIPISKFC